MCPLLCNFSAIAKSLPERSWCRVCILSVEGSTLAIVWNQISSSSWLSDFQWSEIDSLSQIEPFQCVPIDIIRYTFHNRPRHLELSSAQLLPLSVGQGWKIYQKTMYLVLFSWLVQNTKIQDIYHHLSHKMLYLAHHVFIPFIQDIFRHQTSPSHG